MHRWFRSVAAFAAIVAVLGSATEARAEDQRPRVMVSARYAFGLGHAFDAPEGAHRLRIEQGLRLDALFGPPGDRFVRVGPMLDLRFQRFDSAEAAIGASVLLPIARGYPITLSGGLGYGLRRGPEEDGLFGVATLAFGYRSYNYHGPYAQGYQLYVSARMRADGSGVWEVTGGVEIDLQGMVAIPAMALVTLFRGGPPDE